MHGSGAARSETPRGITDATHQREGALRRGAGLAAHMAGQAKVDIDETSLTSYEPDKLLRALGSLHAIDARETHEFDRGAVKGARRFGKSDILFSSTADWVRTLVHELVESALPICVYSEFGIKGQNTSRDLFVIWYLHEAGVPFERLGRLIGGITQWQQEGLPLEKRRPEVIDDLDVLLRSAKLPEAQATALSVAGVTLPGLLDLHATAGRAGVLAHLAANGVARLAERQAVANAVGRASRAQAESQPSD